MLYGAFLCAIASFAYALKGPLRFWYLIFIDGLLSLLMLGDLMYFRAFGQFLSPYLLSQSSNLDNLFSSIVSMLRPIDVWFVADLVLFLLFSKLFTAFYRNNGRNVLVFLFFLMVSLSTIYYQHYRMDLQNLKGNDLFQMDWVANQTMTDLSPAGYHLYDLFLYFSENQPYDLKMAEAQDIQLWLTQKAERLPPNEFHGIFKGKNLLVIQVESLENTVLNQKVDGQEITPTLNRLLKNSLYFPNLYEQVLHGNSSDADLLTNTSVYPLRNGATFFRFPSNSYSSLPQLMKQKGYRTLGIHSDKGSYWNWMPALQAIGFDQTYDVSHFEQDEIIGLGLSDGSYFSQVATLLGKVNEPFYTFMVTLTSHSPFDLPPAHQELKLEGTLANSKLGGYFQSIRYTDREIGAFLEKLNQHQLLDDTVVVIYGDHTGVHKYYNDEVQQLEPKQDWWLDYSKRVPLLIYSKDLKGQALPVTGGQIDILPTLAYLFDLDESYQETALGRNLLNTNRDFAILANREFIGQAKDEVEKAFLLKGIDLSDLIIRSNYFE